MNKASTNEMRQIVWNQLGLRVSPTATITQLEDLLAYKISEADLPDNAVNTKREEIMAFIEKYKSQLSMPCDGNCYAHSDGVVVSCYKQLMEETDG